MHWLIISTSLTFAQNFSNASRRVWSDKKESIFFSVRPEEQIILTKLSHRDKIKPGVRLLYFMSARVWSDEIKTRYFSSNRLSMIREEPFDLNGDKKTKYFECGRPVKSRKIYF